MESLKAEGINIGTPSFYHSLSSLEKSKLIKMEYCKTLTTKTFYYKRWWYNGEI